MGCIPKRYWILILASLSFTFVTILELFSPVKSYLEMYATARELNFWSEFSYTIGKITSLAGGVVGNRYGGAVVFGSAMLLKTVYYNLQIFLNTLGSGWLRVGRFLEGILHALMCSSIADVWSRWSPLENRSKYVSFTLAGQHLATELWNWLLPVQGETSNIMKLHVFRNAGFKCALATAILAAIWLLVVRNDPSDDENLSDNERAILEPRLKYLDKSGVAWNNYPWLQILKSKQVWVLNSVTFVLGMSSSSYILLQNYFLQPPVLTMDEYYSQPNNFLDRFPHIKNEFVSVLVTGYILDRFANRNIHTNNKILKLMVCISFLAQGFLPLPIDLFPFGIRTASIFIVLISIFECFTAISMQVNAIDLSPRYACLLIGIQTAFFELGKLIITIIIHFYGWVIYKHSKENWVIYILTVLHIGGALLYYVWGSWKPQSWNSSSKEGYELEDRNGSANI